MNIHDIKKMELWCKNYFELKDILNFKIGYVGKGSDDLKMYISIPIKGNDCIIKDLESKGWKCLRRERVYDTPVSMNFVFYQKMIYE